MAATTVVNAAYDTSGNGGRKLVRLSNGWLVAVVKDSTVSYRYYLYVSKDNGQTWSALCNVDSASSSFGMYGGSLASFGNYVYFVHAMTSGGVFCYKIDALTQTNVNIYANKQQVDPNTIATFTLSQTSLVVNNAGTEIHLAYNKKLNGQSSDNIFYAKGAVDGSGNVTWGSVTQVTTHTTSGYDAKNPCVVVKSDGNPIIFNDFYNGSTYYISSYRWDGSQFVVKHIVTASSYAQSNPCAVVDGNGVIHVVWDGLDATDSSARNIRYSKSADGGVTWDIATKLTSGAYTQQQPVIGVDKASRLYALWMGIDPTISISRYQLRRRIFNTTWNAVESITNSTTIDSQHPNIMERESNSMIGWIYRRFQSSIVVFDSIALNQAPTLTLTSPADNQTLLAGGTLEIEGTASDADGDSITVIANLNGTALVTVGLGVGTANWTVSIPEPSLQLGDNTLVVTAIDGQGATASKTLKLTKTDGDVPLLVNDVRYKLPATDDVVAWAKREGELTVDAALSGVAAGESEWFTAMEKTATSSDEDQFYKALPVKKDNVTLRLTMTRQSVDDDVAITRLIGGIGK
ncbi:Ig-like domain-containing protein [Brevibacillus agri]|uniref:Ig-like domain-containing protein n=1 Tax=Brevibacillus agri TaxID=51101 RepID=UPI002E214F96|nr:Ig-like domain-containing protein [Brevibacillus agri]MED1652606.1 Ig-like domain-containing protein [Brevibacillus agri]MED1689640.1 Ig-like domain-containing protein [Brevibacillus agri]MED1691122.1 Ig-like domain-containing protein [Brevibacillus agri]MED1696768.1 Ig-like domain-containing protein [Brevibacillus agri]